MINFSNNFKIYLIFLQDKFILSLNFLNFLNFILFQIKKKVYFLRRNEIPHNPTTNYSDSDYFDDDVFNWTYYKFNTLLLSIWIISKYLC